MMKDKLFFAMSVAFTSMCSVYMFSNEISLFEFLVLLYCVATLPHILSVSKE